VQTLIEVLCSFKVMVYYVRILEIDGIVLYEMHHLIEGNYTETISDVVLTELFEPMSSCSWAVTPRSDRGWLRGGRSWDGRGRRL
jgi:hypothetical protein